MAAQKFRFERDAAVLKADAQAGAAFGEFRVEFAFQRANSLD